MKENLPIISEELGLTLQDGAKFYREMLYYLLNLEELKMKMPPNKKKIVQRLINFDLSLENMGVKRTFISLTWDISLRVYITDDIFFKQDRALTKEEETKFLVDIEFYVIPVLTKKEKN